MNGCCWGGACNDNWAAAHFPPGSPVYENQLSTGRLLGMELTRSPDDLPKIESVEPQSLAASTGLQVGDPVHIQIFRESPPPGTPSDDSSYLEVHVSAPGRKFQWSSDQLPRQAMPVWPAQLISSAFGFLLCCTLLIIGRWIQTPGMLFSIGFSMYAVVRFFEEVIRVDEPGRFGTSLSIAQWVSIFSLMCFMVLMLWIRYCSVSSTKLDSTAIA